MEKWNIVNLLVNSYTYPYEMSNTYLLVCLFVFSMQISMKYSRIVQGN